MAKLKLLTKKEVDVAKAKDRSREVAEGRKLAESVDRLREVRAEEEVSLEKFRQKSLTTIHNEITELSTKKDELVSEVSRLTSEAKALRIPLDSEWRRLRNEQSQLNEQRLEFDLNVHTFGVSQRDFNEQFAEFQLDKRKLEFDRLNLDASLGSARRKDEQAQENLVETQKIHESETKNQAVLNKRIKEQERGLVIRTKEIGAKQKLLDTKEEELRIKELQLLDREGTLARNIKRYGNR